MSIPPPVRFLFTAAAALLVFSACASQGPGALKQNRRPRDPVVPIQPVSQEEVDKYLHVPSPDWRDQIIYMIVTDRFDDGNPGNSNLGAGEYNPKENAFYSGGDLKGILDNLDYIKGLGMTSLWITPPVANQWYDPWIPYTGYHGYWARNFKAVDEHYGTLEDYKKLSATLHKNDMYLIQDIVLNHVGNHFKYTGGYDKASPHLNFTLNAGSKPNLAPEQPPFHMNDVRNPEHKQAAIYHWTPDIRDYKNPQQKLNFQVNSLDDLNTTNPVVRKALRDSYAYWIKTVGVDGFRIDTIKYVEHETLHDFAYGTTDPDAPGVMQVARDLGKNSFFITGENLVNGVPFNEEIDKDVASYQGTPDKPEVPYPLNFALAWDIRSVLTEGLATSALTFRFESQKKHYRDTAYLPNFIDSHDIDRFMKAGSREALEQGLAMVFTIPGIPVVYYGTEQNFDQTRSAMFADGFDSKGRDHFNPQSSTYRWIRQLTELRKSSPVFTRGTMKILKDSPSGSGIFAYEMEYQGKAAFMIFNTAASPTLLDRMPTGLEAGAVLALSLSNHEGLADKMTVQDQGFISMEVPGQTAAVYFFQGEKTSVTPVKASVRVSDLKAGAVLQGNTLVRGLSQGVDRVQLIIDGNLSKTTEAQMAADGSWSGRIDAESLPSGPHSLSVRGYAGQEWVLSDTLPFRVDIPFTTVLTDPNPVARHLGPRGTYRYPTDGTFRTQMDIESVSLATAGKNLRVTIKPKGGISTSWNPQYGFDHVSYSVFVDLPGRTGAVQMPYQNMSVPEGFNWDYLALGGGWVNILYSSEGSGPQKFGTPVKPSSQIKVDYETGTVSFIIQAEALGFPESLSGTKVYITTWDYDGIESAYRKIEPQPQAYTMGGGDGAKDPLFMDETKVLTVP